MKYPKVSIIIVNYNGKKFLKKLFVSLKKTNYPKDKQEIIMIDNGSSDGSTEYVKIYYPYIKIIRNNINNYCNALNRGITASRSKYVAIINNDIELDKNWLIELVKIIERDSKICAAGSKVFFMDGKLQSVGHQEFPNYYWSDRGFFEDDEGQYDYIQEVPSIPSVCVLYRKKCFEDVGLFDEDFNMYLEDVDMGIRCKTKGWKLIVVPTSKVYHNLHGTIGTEEKASFLQEKNRLMLLAKHYPKELPHSLFGIGYLVKKGHEKEKDFIFFLADIYQKVLKEHKFGVLQDITPKLFDNVRKIFYFEKDFFVQKILNYDKKIKELEQEIEKREQEIEKREQEIEKKEYMIIDSDKEISKLKLEKEQVLKNIESKSKQLKETNSDLERIKGIKKQQTKVIEDFYNRILEQKEILFSLKDNLKDLEKELKCKQESLDISTQGYKVKQEELEGIYNSTGFKYLLKPLWLIVGLSKRLIKTLIKKICYLIRLLFIFPLHPINISKKLLISLNYFINRFTVRNKWLRCYLNNIFKSAFPPSPRYLKLMLTSKSNLRYSFYSIPEKSYDKAYISKDKVIKILDSAIRLGIKEVEITGGEPLLHPDLWEIVDYAKDKGIDPHLVTNGILIKEQLDKVIKAPLKTIAIFMDVTNTIYEELENKKGVYNDIIESVNLLKNAGKNIAINFILTDKSIYLLENIYKQFTDEDIPVFFWPVNERKQLYIRNTKHLKLYRKFIKKLKKDKIISKYWYKYLKYGALYFKRKNIYTRCLGLSYNIAIDVEGNILPCCLRNTENLKLANVYNEDLEVIYYSKRSNQIRHHIFYRGCLNCYSTDLVDFSKITGLNFLINPKIDFKI